MLSRPPPYAAELLLTAQSVSVVLVCRCYTGRRRSLQRCSRSRCNWSAWPCRTCCPGRRRRQRAELPLTVQSVSDNVPPYVTKAAAASRGGVAADGAIGQRQSAAVFLQAAALPRGGVAADGAIGQRQRAAVVKKSAAARAVEPEALPPLIVSPSSAADPPSMSNTRLLPPPLNVSSLAPGPTIVMVAVLEASARRGSG